MPHNRYAAIPRVLCFLRHGERWLLIRRAPDRRLFPGLCNGVGGHVEEGEGILAAARREVMEETGLEAEDLRLVGIIHEWEWDHGVLVFVFTGTAATTDLRPSPEGIPLWLTAEEALRQPLVPDLPQILARLIARRPDDPPFIARSTCDRDWHLEIEFEQG